MCVFHISKWWVNYLHSYLSFCNVIDFVFISNVCASLSTSYLLSSQEQICLKYAKWHKVSFNLVVIYHFFFFNLLKKSLQNYIKTKSYRCACNTCNFSFPEWADGRTSWVPIYGNSQPKLLDPRNCWKWAHIYIFTQYDKYHMMKILMRNLSIMFHAI